MPFKSKAQQRFMFAAEARGDLKPGTAREWAHKTKNIKKLPERVGEDEKKAGVLEALEKFAAFTPSVIRSIARDGDVEVDQPEFKEKCRSLTGEAHLDKMSPGQLGQVAKMLWSKEASARKERKPAKSKPSASPSKKKKSDDPMASLAKGVAGATAPIATNTAAVLLAHEAPRTGHADFAKEKNFRSLERDMGQTGTRKIEGPYAGMGEITPTNNKRKSHQVAPRPAPEGDWGVVLPKGTSEATAGHELGHRANWKAVDNLVGKPTSRNLFRGALASQLLTTAASVPLSAYTATDPEMSWAPGAVQLGVSSPRLLDEAAASLHALKHLIGKYGLGKGIREGARLAPAFGSYAALAGAPLAITAGRRAWHHFHPDEE